MEARLGATPGDKAQLASQGNDICSNADIANEVAELIFESFAAGVKKLIVPTDEGLRVGAAVCGAIDAVAPEGARDGAVL